MSKIRLRSGHFEQSPLWRFLQHLKTRLSIDAVRFGHMRSIISGWIERSAQRHALSQLDPHRLKDIGLTKQDVERECSKAFWQ